MMQSCNCNTISSHSRYFGTVNQRFNRSMPDPRGFAKGAPWHAVAAGHVTIHCTDWPQNTVAFRRRSCYACKRCSGFKKFHLCEVAGCGAWEEHKLEKKWVRGPVLAFAGTAESAFLTGIIRQFDVSKDTSNSLVFCRGIGVRERTRLCGVPDYCESLDIADSRSAISAIYQ